MRVTKWGEYGILCCLFLAHKFEDESPVGAAEIAEVQDIPIQYTQQILQRLRKGEIIKSIRGPHGGYKLERAPQDISLKDVFTAAEGDTFELICDSNPVYKENCGVNTNSPCCGLRTVWTGLKTVIDDYLGSKTLADVLEKHEIMNRSEQRGAGACGGGTCELIPMPSSPDEEKKETPC
jgi:Rrf2 family iron-sulfur cluster assembly transcriptional regulator